MLGVIELFGVSSRVYRFQVVSKSFTFFISLLLLIRNLNMSFDAFVPLVASYI